MKNFKCFIVAQSLSLFSGVLAYSAPQIPCTLKPLKVRPSKENPAPVNPANAVLRNFDLVFKDQKVLGTQLSCEEFDGDIFIEAENLDGIVFKAKKSVVGVGVGDKPIHLKTISDILNSPKGKDCLRVIGVTEKDSKEKSSHKTLQDVFNQSACKSAFNQIENVGDFFQQIKEIDVSSLNMQVDATYARDASTKEKFPLPACKGEWSSEAKKLSDISISKGKPLPVADLSTTSSGTTAEVIKGVNYNSGQGNKEQDQTQGQNNANNSKKLDVAQKIPELSIEEINNSKNTKTDEAKLSGCSQDIQLTQLQKKCGDKEIIVTCETGKSWEDCLKAPVHIELIGKYSPEKPVSDGSSVGPNSPVKSPTPQVDKTGQEVDKNGSDKSGGKKVEGEIDPLRIKPQVIPSEENEKK